jgi:four helix bundle protein
MPDALIPGPAPDAVPLFPGAALLDPKRGQSNLRDQLDRASVSIVLNIAEGAGRTSALDKARFYAIARGSATERAAIVDVLAVRGLIQPRARAGARSLLVRIVQMLTRLIASLVRSGGRLPRTLTRRS